MPVPVEALKIVDYSSYMAWEETNWKRTVRLNSVQDTESQQKMAYCANS